MANQQQDDSMFSFMGTQGYTLPFFGCLGDITLALSTYCCGCLVVGSTAGKLFKPTGDFDVTACLCAPIAAYRIRRKTQEMFGITESHDASMFAVGCGLTSCCAVVQDVHELTKRGAIAPLLGDNKTAAGQPQMQTT
ncbi:hypothetical protein HK101_003371, partial [Irineochytrium annulatum]